MSETEVQTETPAEKAPRTPVVVNKIEGGPKKFFAGKLLFATLDANPRKAGVPGEVSYQLILDNPGIAFKTFLENGGRIQDVAWDYERGRVRVEDDGVQTPVEESVEA